MKPTVGRIVHYVARGSADGRFPSVCRAAIVTEVPALLSSQPNTGPDGYVPAVHLSVHNPGGVFFDRDVPHHPGDPTLTGPLTAGHSGCERHERAYPGGTWHWPERPDEPTGEVDARRVARVAQAGQARLAREQ